MPTTPIDILIPREHAPSSAAWRKLILGPRERRVIVLLGAIALLGAVDLLLTLHAMKTSGMFEANPIVLWLIRVTESTHAIAAYKSATIVIGSHLLYRLRRHRAAEAGAWLAVAAFAAVIASWAAYVDTMAGFPIDQLETIAGSSREWIVLE